MKGYYLLLITARKKVAKIGYHDIYQVKDIKMVSLFRYSNSSMSTDETRYVDLFKQIKIGEGFYFSYTYDLTHTMQHNVMRRMRKSENKAETAVRDIEEHEPFESHFLWNNYLIKEFYQSLVKKRWVMPVIYGDISYLNFRAATKNCTFVLVSRRSRRYAGTRYLKRGINEHGNVANFVEVEQICYINEL